MSVLFCFFNGKIVGLIDRRNEFQRPPGHIGSLALWKWGKKPQNITHAHRIEQVRKEASPVKYFNAIEAEMMTI